MIEVIDPTGRFDEGIHQSLQGVERQQAHNKELRAERAVQVSESVLKDLWQQLEDKIPDTPERMNRIRQHKERIQTRGGEDDDDSVEAYADIMNRMQYYKDRIKYLHEEEKKSRKCK